jgi:phosphoserine phosphatase
VSSSRGGRRPRVASHIAVVFDFDGTLMPDSSSLFLQSRGIDVDDFWKRANARLRKGWDQALAWLDLLLEETGPAGRLAGLTQEDLTSFGESLDGQLFPGVRALFADLRRLQAPFGVDVEFYIVSGGLRPLIQAVPTVRKYVTAVYASEFGTDGSGRLRCVKRAVTFTEKTRYLFEIHKGLPAKKTEANPFLVNTFVEKRARRVPFEHMIYVGDGDTDIPCFSLVESNGGIAFGVVHASKEAAARKKVLQLLALPPRVRSLHPPDYRHGSELAEALRLATASISGRIAAFRDAAYS